MESAVYLFKGFYVRCSVRYRFQITTGFHQPLSDVISQSKALFADACAQCHAVKHRIGEHPTAHPSFGTRVLVWNSI